MWLGVIFRDKYEFYKGIYLIGGLVGLGLGEIIVVGELFVDR